tara:strand:+ start:4182 stop:4445 length:264 start_codon:yes stop_codon:yes gene_type:complete
MGAAPAVLEADEAPGAALEVAAGAMVLVGVGWPEVNGTSEADEAPEKAGEPAVAEGLAMVALVGLRTLEVVLVENSRAIGRIALTRQ